MTVSNQTPLNSYTANGVTTAFTFGFLLLLAGDLVVKVTDTSGNTSTKALGVDYTVSGTGVASGGTVTFLTAPASGYHVTVYRDTTLERTTDYQTNGDLLAATLNGDLDRMYLLLQEIFVGGKGVPTSLRVPNGETVGQLPDAGTRANRLLGFDSNGAPTVVVGVDASSATALTFNLADRANFSLGAALVGGAARVVDSIAVLRTLPKTGSSRVFVTGYYAAGDGGGGVYYYDSADLVSADNGGTIILASDAGRWKLAQSFPVSIKQFGAKGDGSTDDRAAIQNAIDAALPGATIRIPTTNASFYKVTRNGANSYCLSITKPLNIIGDGIYAAIAPDSSATATINTIALTPSPIYGFLGTVWDGFTLGNPNTGTRNGNHGIFIDTQVAGSQLAKPIFRNLDIMQSSGTGNAIYHLNNGTNNVNGGMYCAEIVDCPGLKGGIRLDFSGDSNIIQRNNISGNGIGIRFSLVAGASLLTIVDNNITTNGGQIYGRAGARFKILNNNMEQQVATTGSTVMVFISGEDGTMVTGEIRGNHMGAFTGSNITSNITLGANTGGVIVEDNTLLNSNAGFAGPCITNAGARNRIGSNQYGTNITTTVTDTGTGTVGVKKTLTLLNSWVTQSGFPAPYYIKDADGFVHLHGEIASGTAVNGTAICTLPADVLPTASQDFPCVVGNGGTPQAGGFSINASTGSLTFLFGANGQFGLSCCYRAANANAFSSDL